MQTNKLDDNTYEVVIYDWVRKHRDYICGWVKRTPTADEESDVSYWMFYPLRGNIAVPMSCGDLRRLSKFISDLNMEEEK